MTWIIQFHGAFEPEYNNLPETVQDSLLAHLGLLAQIGPHLGRPRVDTLKGSKHANMKELRFEAHDGVWRFAFAFDTQRNAIILIGGNKSGKSEQRFYKQLIQEADNRFDYHLQHIGDNRDGNHLTR